MSVNELSAADAAGAAWAGWASASAPATAPAADVTKLSTSPANRHLKLRIEPFLPIWANLPGQHISECSLCGQTLCERVVLVGRLNVYAVSLLVVLEPVVAVLFQWFAGWSTGQLWDVLIAPKVGAEPRVVVIKGGQYSAAGDWHLFDCVLPGEIASTLGSCGHVVGGLKIFIGHGAAELRNKASCVTRADNALCVVDHVLYTLDKYAGEAVDTFNRDDFPASGSGVGDVLGMGRAGRYARTGFSYRCGSC